MSIGPAIAPTPGLAVATAASAPQPASGVAAIAAQVVEEVVADLTEALPAPAGPSALTAMVGEAATRQDSLAPLLADLSVAVNSPALPASARAAAAQILAAQTPLDQDVTAQALRTAAQGSGVFLEASLAAAVLGPDAGAPNVQMDLKALLLQLADELAPLIEGPAQTRAPGSGATAAPPSRASTSQLEPPVGGGPTVGQPAARPSLDLQVQTEPLARALQQEAQSALARVQLSQAGSVPRAGEPTRWMFEVPIASPDGAGVAQFEISRDGRGPSGGGPAEPSWRARFSVNVAPGGPVHADVMLGKNRARVTLMAEDAVARQALEANQAELAAALAAENGPDVAVRIVGGAPPRPQQPPGQLLDRRS
jgi:hypothetical protein